MKFRILGIALLVTLLWAAVTTVWDLRQRDQVARLTRTVEDLRRENEDLAAKMEGLREANTALHRMLQLLREAERMEDAALTQVPPVEETVPEPERIPEEPPEFIPDVEPMPAIVDSETGSPPPSPGVPTPSPQLRQMAAQFPGLDLDVDAVMNQPNTIQQYMDANPDIKRELEQPAGKYGAGIQAVMDQYPDLAEKVREAEKMANPTQPEP